VEPSVTVDSSSNDQSEGFGIKISSPVYELNVFIPACDVLKLNHVRTAAWIDGSLRIGETAGAPAFWSIGEDNRISILVGHDDQTWDFAVMFPMSTFEEVLRQVAALSRTSKEA
jgi:hypothetical protein